MEVRATVQRDISIIQQRKLANNALLDITMMLFYLCARNAIHFVYPVKSTVPIVCNAKILETDI